MVNSKSKQSDVKLFDIESYKIVKILEEFKFTNKDRINQINNIVYEINNMIKYHSKNLFLPNYPRIIVDSWDYDNPIAVQLLDLYNLYLKL